MASVSLKSTSKEAAILEFDNASDTSDSEESMNGFIRVSVPGTAAAGDSRELDTGNDEGGEVEDGDDDTDSDSDAWESESFLEDALDNLESTTEFGSRESSYTT